jgi:hypothetical protein
MRFASTGEAQAAAVQNAGNATLSNPFASNTVTTGPDGRPMQSTQFAGGLGDAAAGLQQQAGGLGQAMDWSQFGQVGTGDDARNQAVNASYGQATSRLRPQWDKRMEAQRTQLLNQGFDPTSEGYKGAMQDLNFARNDAYGGAMNSAQMMGQQAGDSVFRNNLMGQQNSISNALRQRGQPLDEMSQLMGLAKFDPNRAMQSQMASTGILKDFMQSQYGQNWHQYDVDSGAAADAMQGGMQAGASGASALMALLPLLAASDERMKTNVIRHDAEALPGVPFASWDYLPEYGPAGRHAGVIAQDLEKVSPRHVFTRSSDGMRFVDYSFLKGDAHE